MTYIADSPRATNQDGAPSKDWVEGLRPSSPTLDLARRSLGLTEESLRAVRLSDFKAPGVDVVGGFSLTSTAQSLPRILLAVKNSAFTFVWI